MVSKLIFYFIGIFILFIFYLYLIFILFCVIYLDIYLFMGLIGN